MKRRYLLISSAIILLFMVALIWNSRKTNNRDATNQDLIIAFYNLENLFDTIDNPGVNDTEFTPDAEKQWTQDRYNTKIANMAYVLSQIGKKHGNSSPSIIGLCEMENMAVLEDLVKSEPLKDFNYEIVHYDSPDARGIDVALLYKSSDFKVTNSNSAGLLLIDEGGNRINTRDQLVVSGKLRGEEMHFIVNHWPARRSGEASSSQFRIAAAKLTRSLVDSILNIDANAKVIVMGDFNDDPTDESIVKHLNARGTKALENNAMYNPGASIFEEGRGSLPYRGSWNLFDQIIVSSSLLMNDKEGYYLDSAYIFKEDFLLQQSGDYKGYTWRTYVGNHYHGGYSDHLPVYISLKKDGR